MYKRGENLKETLRIDMTKIREKNTHKKNYLFLKVYNIYTKEKAKQKIKKIGSI